MVDARLNIFEHPIVWKAPFSFVPGWCALGLLAVYVQCQSGAQHQQRSLHGVAELGR